MTKSTKKARKLYHDEDGKPARPSYTDPILDAKARAERRHADLSPDPRGDKEALAAMRKADDERIEKEFRADPAQRPGDISIAITVSGSPEAVTYAVSLITTAIVSNKAAVLLGMKKDRVSSPRILSEAVNDVELLKKLERASAAHYRNTQKQKKDRPKQ